MEQEDRCHSAMNCEQSQLCGIAAVDDSSAFDLSESNDGGATHSLGSPVQILRFSGIKLQHMLSLSDLVRKLVESNTPTVVSLTRPNPSDQIRSAGMEQNRVHFSFQHKDSMTMFMQKLERNGQSFDSSVFLDTVFDTPSLTLLNQGICLRKRDGTLSLSIMPQSLDVTGDANNGKPLRRYTDLAKIAKSIQDAIYASDEGASVALLHDDMTGECQDTRLRRWIQKICSKSIAHLPTLRYSYSLGKGISINIDTIVLNTHKFTTASLCFQNLSEALEVLECLDLGQQSVWPSMSKLAVVLSQSKDELVRKCVSTSKEYFHGDEILDDGVEHPEYPWDSFPSAVGMAIGAFLPLRIAFHYAQDLKDVQ